MSPKPDNRSNDPLLRILYVFESPYPWPIGGAERHALRLANELVQKGWQTSFVSPYPKAWRQATAIEQNQRIHRLAIPLEENHRFFKRLFYLRLCWFLVTQRRSYDIVDMHLLGTTAFITTVIKLLGKSSILKINTIEHWNFLKSKFNIPHIRAIFRRSFRDLDGFLVLSRFLNKVLERDGIPPGKIHYVQDGISIDLYRDAKKQLRQKLDLPQTGPILLYAGRFIPKKNVPLLVHGFQKIVRQHPDLWLVMLGDGPLMPKVRKLVNNLQLSDRIYFRGIVSNVSEYMSACDIFVLPSDIEGCPNVLLEAMCCRMACVVTRFEGGADEIIIDGTNGCLVDRGDQEGMAAAVHQLIAEPFRRVQWGQAAYETIRNQFNIKQTADSYARVYRMLFESKIK